MPKLKKEKKENEQRAITMLCPIDLSFAEAKKGGFELQVLKPGVWDHPMYGQVEITPEIQQEFADNFKKDLRAYSSSVGLPIDEEHYSDKGATGWIKNLVNKGAEGLFAVVEWNKKGRELIKDAVYRFFSPEFYFQYEDPEDRRLYNNVLVGGALTNRPYFKGLSPVVLSEKLINTHMNLKDICKKVFAELTTDEKSFVTSHFSELNEAEKTTFNELKPEETEEEKTARETAEKEAADKKAKEEAEAKAKADADAAALAEKAAKEAKDNGNNLNMSEAEIVKLKSDAASGLKANEELKKIQMGEKVSGFIYNESNAEKGKLPAGLKDKTIAFAMSLSTDQAAKFFELVDGMPSAKLFTELGESALANNDGNTAPKGVSEDSFALDNKAKELMKANDKLDYQSALVMAETELKK